MRQLPLIDIGPKWKTLVREDFSHNSLFTDSARVKLEEWYGHLLEETDEFSRQIVSFQSNKTETLHRWFKYREGFSASLVECLIAKMELKSGGMILDPFAGSCTTLLVSKLLGINSVGIELLPHCHLAWEAKVRAYNC